MRVLNENDLKAPKRLLCFDLDGTLSQHKRHLPQENKDLIKRLNEKYKIIMVGAGNAPRIYNQMEQFPIDIIANYGMQESANEVCSLFPDYVQVDDYTQLPYILSFL